MPRHVRDLCGITDSSDAVEQARKEHPDKVFYVVKIGYSVAEALADMSLYAYGTH